MLTALQSKLTEQAFIKGMDPGYVEEIVECAASATFDSGQFIVREGEAAGYFYIITRGKVALEVDAPGRGAIVIDTLGEDEVLGWSWLFPPYRWHFDARALELTRAIAFNAACLRGKCEQDPKLGYELVKRFSQVLMERLQATRLRLLDVYRVE